MTNTPSRSEEVLERLEAETGVVYDTETDKIRFTGGGNDTTHFVELVEFLLNEGILPENAIPYVAGYGKIRYLLNTEPIHQDGRDMTRPIEVGDHVYLETNHDSDTKLRYSRQMVEDFILSNNSKNEA